MFYNGSVCGKFVFWWLFVSTGLIERASARALNPNCGSRPAGG